MKKVIIILLIAFYPLSCDILSPSNDGKTEIRGRVINESTGDYIDNISLILAKGIGSGFGDGSGGYQTVSQTKSDNNGSFYLFYDAKDDRNVLALYINKEPYTDLYSIELQNIQPGTKIKNKNYFIYQNTKLKVTINSQVPLEPGTYTLWLPGIGTSVDTVLTTNRAKGNFYNIIKLNYSIDNSNFEIIDSVFCPINTTTNYTFNL